MKDNNIQQLLEDPEHIPGDDLFQKIIGKQLYEVYIELEKIIAENGLQSEWRYYNDGKAWLWKVTFKKKTIVWISLWESYFKTGFYFTEKNNEGILKLNIDETIKASYLAAKPIGKLKPIVLDLENIDNLEDFRKIIDFKKSLK
jgi:hypothetical protein